MHIPRVKSHGDFEHLFPVVGVGESEDAVVRRRLRGVCFQRAAGSFGGVENNAGSVAFFSRGKDVGRLNNSCVRIAVYEDEGACGNRELTGGIGK